MYPNDPPWPYGYQGYSYSQQQAEEERRQRQRQPPVYPAYGPPPYQPGYPVMAPTLAPRAPQNLAYTATAPEEATRNSPFLAAYRRQTAEMRQALEERKGVLAGLASLPVAPHRQSVASPTRPPYSCPLAPVLAPSPYLAAVPLAPSLAPSAGSYPMAPPRLLAPSPARSPARSPASSNAKRRAEEDYESTRRKFRAALPTAAEQQAFDLGIEFSEAAAERAETLKKFEET